ncbi:MAG: preprotein translocase subunit SecE, partial [Candidatus Omnitrophota bacterium]
PHNKGTLMIKKISTFLTEVRGELTKVSWSTREELMGSTAVVLTFTALMTVFIGVIDFLLSFALKIVFK